MSVLGVVEASPGTVAALVGASVLCTLIFPILGLRLRGDLPEDSVEPLASAPA